MEDQRSAHKLLAALLIQLPRVDHVVGELGQLLLRSACEVTRITIRAVLEF